ncbi:MAG: hypothetical protein JRD02_06100 [Deltaproteobacteria bacterium]|nr:hypothetical protein [Deltaproteobacteria bacterium]
MNDLDPGVRPPSIALRGTGRGDDFLRDHLYSHYMVFYFTRPVAVK